MFRTLARPLARTLRHAAAGVDRALIRLAGAAPTDTARVSYGHRRLPGSDDYAVGGIVKLQALSGVFPNTPRRFNLLYLVSSRLPEAPVALARVARAKGARIVLNQNGVAYAGWFGPGWERINAPMAELLAVADYVFYQSDFCRVSADRFAGPARGPWEVLPNAVDTGRFRPLDVRPDRPLTLLLGGSQDQWYRVDTAIRTLADVRRHRPDARLLVTGRLAWTDPRRARPEAEAHAAALGVAGALDFVGPYTQRDAPDIYRRADVLLHTKYNDPCPAVVVEALACGLPVVYSASGGVPELVGSEAGIGVPAPEDWEQDHPPDPAAMAAAVLRVAEGQPRFSQEARRRAVAHFDVSKWLARHRTVFSDLIGAQ